MAKKGALKGAFIFRQKSQIRHDNVGAKGPAKSINELLKRFRDAAQFLVDDGLVERLARSMPKRMKTVIAKEGGPTKY